MVIQRREYEKFWSVCPRRMQRQVIIGDRISIEGNPPGTCTLNFRGELGGCQVAHV